MNILKKAIFTNLVVSLVNVIFGFVQFFILDNFNAMVFDLLLAIINLLFAVVLSIVDLNKNN